MEVIDRYDGRPFPTSLGLARRWLNGRVRRSSSLETIYCAELVATTYQHMGLLPARPAGELVRPRAVLERRPHRAGAAVHACGRGGGALKRAPMGHGDRDEAQLPLDPAHDLVLDLGAVGRHVEDLLRGRDHRVHDQPGHHVQVLGAPRAQVGEPREVGRELAREQPDLAADRLPQRAHAAEPLARDEAEVQAVLVHVAHEDLDRAADDVLGVRLRPGRPDHLAQGPERLVDQRQAELLHAREVPVEGGRDDPGLAADLAQAEAAEAVVLEQQQRRLQQVRARALLALAARSGDRLRFGGSTVVHVASVT